MTKHEQPADSRPERKFLGIPYDWRRPTSERLTRRLWNPKDARLITPKSFGWGYDMNFYWLAHPLEFRAARRGS
jgi:hypothetical protein